MYSRIEVLDKTRSIAEKAFEQTGFQAVDLKGLRNNRSVLGVEYHKKRRKRDKPSQASISLRIVELELEAATNDPNATFTKLLYALADHLWACSTGTQHNQVCVLIMQLSDGFGTPTKGLRHYHERFHALENPWVSESFIKSLTGLDENSWDEFVQNFRLHSAIQGLKPAFEPRPIRTSLASELAAVAQEERANPNTLPLTQYDQTESELRIKAVTVQGFRGAPFRQSISLLKNGNPESILIWGDNGVGKSTFTDAVEFALQGRIDRSVDFESSLNPRLRNLLRPDSRVSVELSDGRTISRELTVNEARRDCIEDDSVSAGFRLAPLVIRRSDLLRFLNTEGQSRGTVFFDYFPPASGRPGLKPDEEIAELRELQKVLFTRRKNLSRRLEALFPESDIDFSDASQFEKFRLQTDLSDVSDSQETRKLMDDLENCQRNLSRLKRKIERGVEELNPRAYEEQLERIRPHIEAVGPSVTESFLDITGVDYVKKLETLIAASGPVSLDIVVTLTDGSTAIPQQIFSEGYKDLLAILFFLSLSKRAAEFGQAKILILDDALQSVDSTIRTSLMNYIAKEFKGWQLVITGHDAAWHRIVSDALNRRGIAFTDSYIRRWKHDEGPVVTSQVPTVHQELISNMTYGSPVSIVSTASLLLEEICNELSFRLPISVTRTRDDRYTLGHLWPGVLKKLAKTELESLVEEIDSLEFLRNLMGAHFNPASQSIAIGDANRFGELVIALYQSTFCPECLRWIEPQGEGRYACRKGCTVVL